MVNKKGDSTDNARIANLVAPEPSMIVNGVELDMRRVAEVAERLGVDKLDVLSIGAYRNARGEWVADYDSAKIEKRHKDDD